MKATELWSGLICYLADNNGIVSKEKQVKVIAVGFSQNYSQRKDSSKIVGLKVDEAGAFHEEVYEDNEYNRKYYAEKIGLPRHVIMKNKRLVSLREGNRRIEAAEKLAAEHERIQHLMETARWEMSQLLVKCGVVYEDISVRARFDTEADAAEIMAVTVRGESIERLIQVFRDFPNGELDKSEEDV